MMNKPILALVSQPKGGAGKTTCAEALQAVSLANGRSTLVVDVDDGNSGFIRRAGKGSALPLAWSTEADVAPQFIEKHVSKHDVTILDLGANLIASEAAVTTFLAELVTRASKSHQIIFFAVSSPNAPGVGRLVREMRNDFEALGEVILIENDVDGSGAFPKDLGTLGITKLSMARIPPGVQAARHRREQPLLDVLKQPEEGYELAMALLAKKLLAFAEQKRVQELFGSSGLDHLRQLAANNPEGLHYTILRLERAGNEAIKINQAYGTAYRELMKADLDDVDDLAHKATRFIAASDAYYA